MLELTPFQIHWTILNYSDIKLDKDAGRRADADEMADEEGKRNVDGYNNMCRQSEIPEERKRG